MTDHTKIALDQYCSLESVDYAILFDGDWGIGKTYSIKEFLNTKYEGKYIYVSLFGLSSINDIENEILKSFVSINNNKSESLEKILNSLNISLGEYKIGGAGFIIKSLLDIDKRNKLKISKSFVFFFDDLERWDGNIKICISYINKLVEQYRAKCIIACAKKRVNNSYLDELDNAMQKTIRHVYLFNHNVDDIFNNILHRKILLDYKDNKALNYIFINDTDRLKDCIEKTEIKNIRIIFISFVLFNYIYVNNKEIFDKNLLLSFYLYQVLLCCVHISHGSDFHKEKKDLFFEHESNSSMLLNQMGYFDEGVLSENQKEILLAILHNKDYICVNSIKNIVKKGYYDIDDFKYSFDLWNIDNDLLSYFDTFKHWYKDNETADNLRKHAFKLMFLKTEIKHPNDILAFSERVCADIDREAFKFDCELFKGKIIRYIDYLFEFETLEYVEFDYIEYGIDGFKFCAEIRDYLIELNNKIKMKNKIKEAMGIWDLSRKGVHISSDKMNIDLFNHIDSFEALNIMEGMKNEQLFEFARAIGSRYDRVRKCNNDDLNNALKVSVLIREKYKDEYSISASHLKFISAVINKYSVNKK
ncbi:hypothetical protein C0W96_02110 [Photobacterium kishitanii]|uniref:hypothetical protein n=1 Tax=Photobacterium kishitanii TaxID=318456 RepID=UPI0005D393AF|nr:hypothetical protein [Photobacterium kishitanii]KJG10733.1 hypothetical protein UB40_05085 [Photobacterium kishitanii]PSV08070.1 hypothetical protein C0W96_02110 [Photobacterium kishitanii]PSV75456.1 hypothetical protein C0W29_11340 [Photobacterium kishitanii]